MEKNSKFLKNYENDTIPFQRYRDRTSRNFNGNHQNFKSNKRRRILSNDNCNNEDDILKLDPIDRSVSLYANRTDNWNNKGQKFRNVNLNNKNRKNNFNRPKHSPQYHISQLQMRITEKDIIIKQWEMEVQRRDDGIADLKLKHERQLLEIEKGYNRKISEMHQQQIEMADGQAKEVEMLKGYLENKKEIILKLRGQLNDAQKDIMLTRKILELTNLRNIELTGKINELLGVKKHSICSKKLKTEPKADHLEKYSAHIANCETLNLDTIKETLIDPIEASASAKNLIEIFLQISSQTQCFSKQSKNKLARIDSLDSIGSFTRSESFNSQKSNETNTNGENCAFSSINYQVPKNACKSSTRHSKSSDLMKFISEKSSRNQMLSLNIDGTKSDDYVMIDYIESPDEMPSRDIKNEISTINLKNCEKMKQDSSSLLAGSKNFSENLAKNSNCPKHAQLVSYNIENSRSYIEKFEENLHKSIKIGESETNLEKVVEIGSKIDDVSNKILKSFVNNPINSNKNSTKNPSKNFEISDENLFNSVTTLDDSERDFTINFETSSSSLNSSKNIENSESEEILDIAKTQNNDMKNCDLANKGLENSSDNLLEKLNIFSGKEVTMLNEIFKTPQLSSDIRIEDEVSTRLQLLSYKSENLTEIKEFSKISPETEVSRQFLSEFPKNLRQVKEFESISSSKTESISSELQDILQLSSDANNLDETQLPISTISHEKFKGIAEKCKQKWQKNKNKKSSVSILHIPVVPCYSSNEIISNDPKSTEVNNHFKTNDNECTVSQVNLFMTTQKSMFETQNETDKKNDKNSHKVKNGITVKQQLPTDHIKQENDINIFGEVFDHIDSMATIKCESRSVTESTDNHDVCSNSPKYVNKEEDKPSNDKNVTFNQYIECHSEKCVNIHKSVKTNVIDQKVSISNTIGDVAFKNEDIAVNREIMRSESVHKKKSHFHRNFNESLSQIENFDKNQQESHLNAINEFTKGSNLKNLQKIGESTSNSVNDKEPSSNDEIDKVIASDVVLKISSDITNIPIITENMSILDCLQMVNNLEKCVEYPEKKLLELEETIRVLEGKNDIIKIPKFNEQSENSMEVQVENLMNISECVDEYTIFSSQKSEHHVINATINSQKPTSTEQNLSSGENNENCGENSKIDSETSNISSSLKKMKVPIKIMDIHDNSINSKLSENQENFSETIIIASDSAIDNVSTALQDLSPSEQFHGFLNQNISNEWQNSSELNLYKNLSTKSSMSHHILTHLQQNIKNLKQNPSKNNFVSKQKKTAQNGRLIKSRRNSLPDFLEKKNFDFTKISTPKFISDENCMTYLQRFKEFLSSRSTNDKQKRISYKSPENQPLIDLAPCSEPIKSINVSKLSIIDRLTNIELERENPEELKTDSQHMKEPCKIVKRKESISMLPDTKCIKRRKIESGDTKKEETLEILKKVDEVKRVDENLNKYKDFRIAKCEHGTKLIKINECHEKEKQSYANLGKTQDKFENSEIPINQPENIQVQPFSQLMSDLNIPSSSVKKMNLDLNVAASGSAQLQPECKFSSGFRTFCSNRINEVCDAKKESSEPLQVHSVGSVMSSVVETISYENQKDLNLKENNPVQFMSQVLPTMNTTTLKGSIIHPSDEVIPEIPEIIPQIEKEHVESIESREKFSADSVIRQVQTSSDENKKRSNEHHSLLNNRTHMDFNEIWAVNPFQFVNHFPSDVWSLNQGRSTQNEQTHSSGDSRKLLKYPSTSHAKQSRSQYESLRNNDKFQNNQIKNHNRSPKPHFTYTDSSKIQSNRQSPKKHEISSNGLLEMGVCSQIVASSLRKSQQAREKSRSSEERILWSNSFKGYTQNDQSRYSHSSESNSNFNDNRCHFDRNRNKCDSIYKARNWCSSQRDERTMTRSISMNTSLGYQNAQKSLTSNRSSSENEHLYRQNNCESSKNINYTQKVSTSLSPSSLLLPNDEQSLKRIQNKSDISEIVKAELIVFYELKKFETENPKELFKAMARAITYYYYDKNPDLVPSKNIIKNYIMEVFYYYGKIKSEKDFLLPDEYEG